MIRRTLILAALVLLTAASGAMARDGQWTKEVTLQLGSIDTANYLDGAAALVNDSLSFYTDVFGVDIPWTQATVRLLLVTADTVFAKDTIGVILQNKMEDDADTIWWNLKVLTKASESAIATAPASYTFRAYNDADTTAGDLYRFKVTIVAEEDSIRAHDQTGILPLNATYRLYAIFRQKGNE